MDLFTISGKLVVDGIEKVTAGLEKATESGKKLSPVLGKIGAAVTSAFKAIPVKDFNTSVEKLTRNMTTQQNKLDLLKRKYADLYMTQGKNSKEAKACAKEIENLSKELQKNKQSLEKAKSEANKFDKSLDDTKKTMEETADTAEKSGDAIQNSFSKIGTIAGTVARAGAAALAAVGTGMAALTKMAVENYGDYEQLVGGAQLMFGEAYDYIAEKSANAYKTVQMSQNDYLTQVNGFATGLKTALGGNAQAAAELADRIITAEADVVSATGNSQEAVQNAFNGIMKSNFTMLDNLQIGITPTKEGFQEVIDKVNEWNAATGEATAYQIENLADCQNALIDYIEMQGLSGYAADEAAGTIQGSLAMTKAAWQNLLTGMSDPAQDLGVLVDSMVTSAGLALDNLAPRIINLLPRLTTAIGTLIKKLNKKLPGLIREMLPALLSGAVSLIAGLIAEIPSMLSAVWDAVKATWETLKQEFPLLADIENAIEKIIGAFEPLQPIFKDLKNAFEKVKEAAQPLIGKFGEYVTEGGLVKDITDGIETAAGFLADTYDSVKTIIETVIGLLPEYCTNGELAADAMDILNEAVGFVGDAIDFVVEGMGKFSDWCSEHTGTIETIAIIIGSFAAAWGLVNGAIELWNVIGVIATAVTTGFGAAMTFLTSPITLIILAIGVLIAIVVLLVKNWDTVKETAQKCVDKIVEIWGVVCDWFDENVVQPVVEKFQEIWNSITEVFSGALDAGKKIVEDIKQGISDAWAGITNWFSNLWNGLFGNLHADVSVSKTASEGGVDGSHARGLDFVPFDGYVAELHKGEMVVPAAEARALRSGYSSTQNGEMASLLKQILTAIEDSNRKETVLKINNREFGRAVRGAVNA